MDYLLLARIAKAVALIGFVLPWVTVSCSGTEILSATGLQLMTGDLEPSGAFAQMGSQQTDDAEPSVAVILACAIVVIGLAAGVLLKGKRAAGAIVAAAVLSIGLSYFSIQNMRSELTREASETQGPAEANPYFSAEQQRELSQAAASAIRIEEQEGYWLTIGALGVAAILAMVVLASASAVAPRKEETPS